MIISELIDSAVLAHHEKASALALAIPYELQTLLTMVEDSIFDSSRRRAELKTGN